MGNQIVSVLRDTGCTEVIVKQSLVISFFREFDRQDAFMHDGR